MGTWHQKSLSASSLRDKVAFRPLVLLFLNGFFLCIPPLAIHSNSTQYQSKLTIDNQTIYLLPGMPTDIRSFFAPKGQAAPTPAKGKPKPKVTPATAVCIYCLEG